MQSLWTEGNDIRILEWGDAYYDALTTAIESAEHEVIIESYIYAEDSVGKRIADSLIRAAKRGVQVYLVLDGFGSMNLSEDFVSSLKAAGVRVHVFRHRNKLWSLGRIFLRRLHRKTAVIDHQIAFVGGINIIEDQLSGSPNSLLDYAVSVRGPLVENIRTVTKLFLARLSHDWRTYFKLKRKAFKRPPPAGTARAAFIIRDNIQYRRQIEEFYRGAVENARSEVILANAYFLPGVVFQRHLIRAARRGVRVALILQGRAEYLWVKWATEELYRKLVAEGIEIYEYDAGILHAKVAVVDSTWSTVGSCNLDPLSLLMNLEGNVVIDDAPLSDELRNRLQRVIDSGCHRINRETFHPAWPRRFLTWLSLTILSWIPTNLGGQLPDDY